MGNKTGWIIAGAIALFVLAVVLFVFVFPSHSDPTKITRQKGILDKSDMTAQPSDVLGRSITGPGNAGDDYAKAVKILDDNFHSIGSALDMTYTYGQINIDGSALSAMKNIADLVIMGSAKKEMQYTLVHTPQEFIVDYFYDPADKLLVLNRAMDLLLSYYHQDKMYEKGVELSEAMLVMGRQLADERARPHMTYAGISIQQNAAERLMSFYKKTDQLTDARKTALGEYLSQLKIMKEFYTDKQASVFDIGKLQAGDIFNVAENDKDRAWRVQAILWLGVLKFTAADNRGDMKYVDKLIDKYIDSSDPMEAAAAKAAKNIDEAEFNRLGAD